MHFKQIRNDTSQAFWKLLMWRKQWWWWLRKVALILKKR